MFISYSQNFEDIMLWRALRHVENGFYIDVGAAGPDIISVTRAFYDRGWHGINIEPNKNYWNELQKKRTRDINLCIAIGNKEEQRVFYEVNNADLSSLDSEIAERHRAKGYTICTNQIEVNTLTNICEEYVKGDIHFLKIDVEGAEKEVLEELDFKRFRPWILVIESTYPETPIPTHHDWEPGILANCYRFVYFDGLNRFYVAEEHHELIHHFLTPPNVFDNYKNFFLAQAEEQIEKLHLHIAGQDKNLQQSQLYVKSLEEQLFKLKYQMLQIAKGITLTQSNPVQDHVFEINKTDFESLENKLLNIDINKIPVKSDKPLIGFLLQCYKRFIRKSTFWLFNPLFIQLRDFGNNLLLQLASNSLSMEKIEKLINKKIAINLKKLEDKLLKKMKQIDKIKSPENSIED
jgi:FkbM family methyltransferase